MERYTRFAGWYDLVSAEAVYRVGRLTAIPALGLEEGDRVLDVGCGTGLNLPLLLDAVGRTGQVVGLDRSPQMLAVAAAKAADRGADNVTFVPVDATQLVPEALPETARTFDAVLFTYSLSLMPRWRQAWSGALAVLKPGGRAAIVDMQPPTGLARIAEPLARLACAMGGSDITARPWTTLEQDLSDVRAWSLRGGHIQVRVGRKP